MTTNLQYSRLLKGVYNYFENPLSKPSTMANTLTKMSFDVDTRGLFQLGIQKNRPDLLLALTMKGNFDDLSYRETINKLFISICTHYPQYLKYLLDASWFEINEHMKEDIYKMCIARPINRWYTHLLLSKWDEEEKLLYDNKKKSVSIIFLHKKGAKALLYLEKTYPKQFVYGFSKIYHQRNPELVERSKKFKILFVFFMRYVLTKVKQYRAQDPCEEYVDGDPE